MAEQWPWPCLVSPLPPSLLGLFGWCPRGPVQLSARGLMGTGGWGSSAFSGLLGTDRLANWQPLGRPLQWATPTQQSPDGALLAPGCPGLKYSSQLWNISFPVEKSSNADELYSDRILCISSSWKQVVVSFMMTHRSDDILLGHPCFPHHWPQWSRGRRDREGWRAGGQEFWLKINCTAVLHQSDSGLLLCQINIEVSGAPCCSPISARCSEGGRERPRHSGAATLLIHPR